MSREIQLSKGAVAIVDECDYERLSQYKWALHSCGYAVRQLPWRDGRPTGVSVMHREIMVAPSGQYVDHVNGNKLDNRRENLRMCSNSQNMANRRAPRVNRSGFKGVHFFKRDGTWRAAITQDYKTKHIGYYATPEEAARAYDIKARELFGEFAQLNFPEGSRESASIS